VDLNREFLRKLPLALRIEIEENVRRKDLTQSELATQQRHILDELRKHRKPGARTDLKKGKGTHEKAFSEVRATAVVGKLFNESHKQVEKRLAIVDAAEAEPKKYGKLLADMDRTGRVDAVHREMRQRGERAAYEARAERGGRIDDLAAVTRMGHQFKVIYADPPWEFRVNSGRGKQRTAERRYDASSLDALKALPVASLADDDCALFLWCVLPELPGALELIRSWGFAYKTVAFVWLKTTRKAKAVGLDGDGLHWGMGYYTRANAELCLIATRGSPLRLAEDVHQVIVAPVGEHSAKPEEARARIERLYAGPYLELFARRAAPRWTTWGNEVAAPFSEAAE
jgi:N6-adenosine-specific RNA methylase IME4